MILRHGFLTSLVSILFITSCSTPIDEVDQGTNDPDPEQKPKPEKFYVPSVRINVEGGQEIESKDEYLNAKISILKGYEIILSAS